jgi:tetratricopeptide (TPR) repeat protein
MRLARGLCLVVLLSLFLPGLVLQARSKLADVDTRCPLFGHPFTAQALAGGDDFAAFDSDLCKRPPDHSLYVLAVWTCPYCFFSAYQSEYLEPLPAQFREMELRRYPLGKPPADIEQREIFVGIKFHNAETFYRQQGRDAWFLYDLMLRGTYACRITVLEGSPEFQILREQWIQQSWPRKTRFSVEDVNLAVAARVAEELAEGKPAKDSVASLRYLRADALRRAGEHLEAAAIFEDLLEEASLGPDLLRAARSQLALCIKEGDFQQKALDFLQQAQEEGLVPAENATLSVYMQGELMRRLGHPREARKLYQQAAKLPVQQEFLAALIEKQLGRLQAAPASKPKDKKRKGR